MSRNKGLLITIPSKEEPHRTFGGFRFVLADRGKSALDLLDTPDPLVTCRGLGDPISKRSRARLRVEVRMNRSCHRGPC